MSRSRTRAVIAAAVVFGAAPIATATAVAPAGAARTPGLFDCARTVQVRPKAFALACGDGNVGLVDLSWSSFGGTDARGGGVLEINGCDPNCADGSFSRTHVRIFATRIRTIAGKPSYTRLRLTARDGRPAGDYGIDADGPYARTNR